MNQKFRKKSLEDKKKHHLQYAAFISEFQNVETRQPNGNLLLLKPRKTEDAV
jgi:hypothetical protein